MIINTADLIWLNDADVCSIEQLADVSGLSIDEIDDLIKSGVIAPVDNAAGTTFFQLHYVTTAMTARRLRDDFELDRHGVALALTLMQRINELEAELKAVHGNLRQAMRNWG
jgi:chaperone modulatory protein CbpM